MHAIVKQILSGVFQYRMQSRWIVEGNKEDVAEILLQAGHIENWWKHAFLTSSVVRPGDKDSVGLKFRCVTRGWLPYHIRFQLEVQQVDLPNSFEMIATGDFEGRVVGTVHRVGDQVHIKFDWRVQVRRRLLRLLSPFFRPVMVSNHYWVMNRGQEGICREMTRRASLPCRSDSVVRRKLFGFYCPVPFRSQTINT